jgi:hypothetical protein
MQPIAADQNGVLRFKYNAIVRHLLDVASRHGHDLNRIAAMDFPREDYVQLMQLIGYSLSGFGELGCVDDDTYRAAAEMAEAGVSEDAARIKALQGELDALRDALREPVARLFGVHPDDLGDAKNLRGE